MVETNLTSFPLGSGVFEYYRACRDSAANSHLSSLFIIAQSFPG